MTTRTVFDDGWWSCGLTDCDGLDHLHAPELFALELDSHCPDGEMEDDPKVCADCETPIPSRAYNKVRCAPCHADYKREYQRLYQARKRAEQKELLARSKGL